VTSPARFYVVVGTPGSGKDILIRAVHDLGSRHAEIVPKHTTRPRRHDDGNEMICSGDSSFDMQSCNLLYENYGDTYGINTSLVWRGIERRVSQVAVISSLDAINKLHDEFGELLSLIYVHSELKPAEYAANEIGKDSDSYVARRSSAYKMAWDLYTRNFLAFDHVIIYSSSEEDLYDQVFRIFRARSLGFI
jgi:guanylate kinase